MLRTRNYKNLKETSNKSDEFVPPSDAVEVKPKTKDVFVPPSDAVEVKKKEPSQLVWEEKPSDSSTQPTFIQPSLVTEKPTKQSVSGTSNGVPKTPKSVSDDSIRNDGTQKQTGYFGTLKMQDGSGKDATEISIGVEIEGKETEIPTLVPTLSESEKNYLLKGGSPNDKKNPIAQSIIKKAVDFAYSRKKEGKPYFADNEEYATSGGVIDDKVVPKVIYVNKDPKYGPVESIPKDIPYGTAYEVVKNSVQLKKWREQNIQEPNILEREGKKAVKGVNKFLDVLTNIVTLGTQEESPISIPGGDENAYQLARKVNDFRTNLPDYSKTADEEYQEAKSGGDWWQKTKEAGASALNFMADVITQSVRGDEKAPKMEVDSPLKKYEDDVLKNAAENNETLSQEEIDKRTEFAFKQDRISNLRQSDLNSFNYNLSPSEQKILQNYTSEQTSHLKDEQKKILSSINIASAIADKSVSDFDKEIKRQNAIISSGGQVTPEDKNTLSILEKKANEDTQQLQYSQKKYFENTNDLGTFEQERDIFSKEGNRIIDSFKRLNISLELLAAGGVDFASYLSYNASLLPKNEVANILSTKLHSIAVGINRDVENTEKFLVETTNANTPEDYLNKILNFTFESAPMVALGATGVGGVVAMGATSAGQKFGEEYDSKGETWKKIVAPVLYGGAMMIPVAQGLKIVKHGKRVVSAIEPQLMKQTVSQYAKNAVKKVSKFGGESFDTAVAFKAQGAIQIVGVNHLILGKEIDYNELFDMKLYESAGFALLNKAVPLVMGMATKPFFSEKEYKIIDANSKKILELTKELDKATKEQKAITQDVINTLSKNSRDLIKSKLKQIESMPETLQKKVIDTYVEQSKLRQEALVIKASRMSIENKKTALEVKQEEYREVSKLRNDINSGTYLEIDLPENKLKYESLAVKELIKENEGKSFDFKPEDVRKKAIELLDKDNKNKAKAKLDEVKEKIKKVEIPDWHREEYDERLAQYEESIADAKKYIEEEKSKNLLLRSKSEIKYYEEKIKFYEDKVKLLKENPVEFYKQELNDIKESHERRLLDQSTYKQDLIDDYGTTDFEVTHSNFIENTNRKISDYEAVQKTTDGNAELNKPIEVTEVKSIDEQKADIEKRREEELNANKKLTEISEGGISGESKLADEINAKYDAEIKALETPKTEVITPIAETTEAKVETPTAPESKIIEYNKQEYYKNEDGTWVNKTTGNEIKGIGTKGKALINSLNAKEKNPTRKYKLTEKGQAFNVEYKNGKLEVTKSDGSKVSKPTERAVLRKHADNYDFTQGEKAMDRMDFEGQDWDNEVAKKSNNASEVAEAVNYASFEDISNLTPEERIDYKDGVIFDSLDKIKEEGFYRFGDRNKKTSKTAKEYFSEDGRKIDDLADELSRDNGIEITPKDIADFIERHPNGKKEFKTKQKENLSQEQIKKNNTTFDLKNKFTELTGLPATPEFLLKAVEQATRKFAGHDTLDQLSDAQLEAKYNELKQFEEQQYGKQAEKVIETTKRVDEVKDTKDTGEVQEGVEKVEPVLSKTDEEFRDKIRDIPNSGLVAKYLSGETIERVEGETPRNNQDIEILNLVEAGNHGKETIEMAKEKYGDKYIDKTLEFLESTNLKPHEKAIVYISLENELFDAVKAEPDNLGLKKLQDLVRAKSQALGREGSLTINAGRLRAIMKDGFDISQVTDKFLSNAELRDKSNVEKAIQSNAEEIQKEYENTLSESDIENLIAEGVAEKINEIYKNLPSQRKIKADKAVKALENIQKKLRGKAYDATIGIPIAILDSGITIIKNSIKAGVSIADAIEIGIKHIKEKYGKNWDKEDEFRTDMFDGFKSEGIKEKEIKSKELSNKEIVSNALIEAGFGKEITVKTKEGKVKRTVLDWRKLAGEEGSIDKIRENVEKIIGEEAAKDLEAEYNNLRARIIEKSLNELENRNTPRSPVSIKTSAKKLAELYNYGMFEKDPDTYDNLLNTALGMSKLNQENFIEAKKLAGKLSELFSQKDNEGNQISQESLKHAERVINRQIENLLSKIAWSDSNGLYKVVIVAKEYVGLAQRNALVSAGQAVENTMSGYISRIFKKIGFAFDNVDTKSLKQSRNALARMTFKDITLNGGLDFGDVTSPFITKSKTQDLIVNASDSQIYHALASTALGKPFLESADSMHKSALAQGYFHYNLIKILRKKGYSKDEAKNYVSEKLTGQSFKDALVTSKQIIDKINEGSDKKIIPDTKESIYRFANDLVNEALIQGNKITLKELEASLKSAETVAGFEIGHEPNNLFSKPLNLLNSWVQVKLDRAVKQKEWNIAASLTGASIVSQNVLNPFVGGGTNWTFLAAQKAGIPTLSTFYWNIKSRSSKLDLSSDSGIKNLEQTLKYQLLAKNANIRMFVGATVSLSAFALFKSTGADDDLYQWLKKNEWANKYFKKIAPPALQFMIAQKNKDLSDFLGTQMNIKIDAFDEGKKIKRAIDNADSGKPKKSLGSIGQLVGSRLNTPIIPWRIVKDARDVYRGLNGLEPVKQDYKTSGFWNGYFQGGMIEQLGLRPEKDKVKVTPKTQEEMEKSMREAMKKVSEQMKKERRQ